MKILIADDSPFILSVLSEFLKSNGFEVETAENGIEAVQKAFNFYPDVIILDVMMPFMTGYQVARMLKTEKLTKEIPIILLTSKSDAADKFWGHQVGADYYVVKDENLEILMEHLLKIVSTIKPIDKKQFTKKDYSPLDIVAKVNELLDKKLYELTILNEIGKFVGDIADLDKIVEKVMSFLSKILEYSVILIMIKEENAVEIISNVSKEFSFNEYDRVKKEVLTNLAKNFDRKTFLIKEKIYGEENLKNEDLSSYKEIIIEKIKTEGKNEGLIAFLSLKDKKFSTGEKSLLSSISNYTFLIIYSGILYQRVKDLSIRDSLTGLYNHGFIIKTLERAFKVADRYKKPLSIIMGDIDKFKSINDNFGHLSGDFVLEKISSILLESIRDIDYVGRYGGEEFLIILPETPKKGAINVAERIRKKIEDTEFNIISPPLRVTISFGVASLEDGIKTSTNLLKKADEALYRAKEKGRNRVEF